MTAAAAHGGCPGMISVAGMSVFELSAGAQVLPDCHGQTQAPARAPVAAQCVGEERGSGDWVLSVACRPRSKA